MMVRRQGEWLTAKVGDELVMMSTERANYIGLNEVGVRIWELEKYITPMLGGREVQTVSLGFDRWVFEIYRTAIETLQGIAWMLLVFFVFALLAFVFVRLGELRREHRDQPSGNQEQSI